MLQALALRYRPRNFSELVGQGAVSKSLTHALDENRLSHAYLFSGLRGSGKTSSARIFSKALVCDHGPTSTPCETCTNCVMANENRHIDIIEMDAASHRGIDDVKGLIEQTKYAPAVARFKIFIIDEVHMLSTPAFNALLKTLEEPPAYVKFILATTDPLKLPATVLSRTQHFRFRQISKPDVIAHLCAILQKENVPYEKEALEILARSGSGSLRDTLTLLDQAIIYSKANLTQSAVADMLGLLDPAKIEQILQLVMSGDKTAVSAAISELEGYDAAMLIDEMIANLKANFIAQSPKYSLLLYERFFRILSQAKGMLNVSSDGGFVIGMMLFMMIEAINLKSIDEMVSSFGANRAQEEANLPAPRRSETPAQNKTASNLTQISHPQETAANPAYEMFLAKIYDRNYELGECFKECIEFLSFEEGCMSLASAATGAHQRLLRDSSKVIMQILRNLFGESAKIKITPKQGGNLGGSSASDSPSSNIGSDVGADAGSSKSAVLNAGESADLGADARANIGVGADIGNKNLSASAGNLNAPASSLDTAPHAVIAEISASHASGEPPQSSAKPAVNLNAPDDGLGKEQKFATDHFALASNFNAGEPTSSTDTALSNLQNHNGLIANEAFETNLKQNEAALSHDKFEPNLQSNFDETAVNLPSDASKFAEQNGSNLNENGFAPDLESMRDDSEDFHTAYSLKFTADNGLAATDELALLDDELRKLESKSQAISQKQGANLAQRGSTQSEINLNRNTSAGQNLDDINEFLAQDESEFESNLSSTEDTLQSQAPQPQSPNLNEQKPQIDPQIAKNNATLKEASRLFGEPQIFDFGS